MLSNALEHVAQVGGRIDVVKQASADQAVEVRRTLAAGVGTRKEVIFAAQNECADRALGGVIVQLDAPVVTKARECLPSHQ